MRGMIGAVALTAFFWACQAQPPRPTFSTEEDVRLADLDALIEAYPQHLLAHDGSVLLWRDGTRMQISDGRAGKSFTELGEKPDIDDIFAWPYPINAGSGPPPRGFEPGRSKPQEFFVKMYGDCRKDEVVPKLEDVRWVGGQTLKFTSANGAAAALAAVARDLEALGPEYTHFLNPVSGTYNCRNVAGSRTYSMHAFGAAIDLNINYADYWRWQPGGPEDREFRNRFPQEIGRIFERHGFIWGARWDRFDTFHFEYRPELILAARRTGTYQAFNW